MSTPNIVTVTHGRSTAPQKGTMPKTPGLPEKYRIIGERVRERREALQLSQYDVAFELQRMMGRFNQSHLSMLERGLRQVSVEVLSALSLVLETSADYLLGLSNNPQRRIEDAPQMALIAERDTALREYIQRILRGIERMPADQREQYYRTMDALYRGVTSQYGPPRPPAETNEGTHSGT